MKFIKWLKYLLKLESLDRPTVRDKLESLDRPTVRDIVDIYKDAPIDSVEEMRDSLIFNKLLEAASKEEIELLWKENIITNTIALRTKKVSYEEILGENFLSFNLHLFIKFASNETKLRLLNRILSSCDNSDSFEIEYAFNSGIELKVFKDKYREVTISFKNNSDVYFINRDQVLSIALMDRKIVLNNIPSRFQFSENDNLEYLDGMLKYLNYRSLDNIKRAETEKQNNISISSGQKKKDGNEPFNPWVAGGMGVLVGAMLSD